MRIGIDVGGTFTDIVAIADDGEVAIRKVSSTVDDYSRAIAEALPILFAGSDCSGRAVREVLHATTVATNAILQRIGARTALITTRGFRDVLELRRMRMPEMYNWNWDKPSDLIERHLRFELTERIDARGPVSYTHLRSRLAGACRRAGRWRNRAVRGGHPMNIHPLASALVPDLIAWRHALHAHPELGFEERWTSNFVAEKLSGLSLIHISPPFISLLTTERDEPTSYSEALLI